MTDAAAPAPKPSRRKKAAAPPEAAPPPPACATCGTGLHGRFCHACGHDHEKDKGFEFLIKDGLAEAFSLEGRTVHTLRDMFWRPARLLNAYRAGGSDYYFSPFKLLLVVSATFFLFVTWIQVPIYQYLPRQTGEPIAVELIPNGIEVRGVEYEDIYLRPKATAITFPELERAYEAALAKADPTQERAIQLYRAYNIAYEDMNDFWQDWLPRLLWLLSPFYVLLLLPFFQKRPWAEHILFAIWAHCLVFVILMAVALINLTGVGMPSRILFPVYLGFFTFAAASYYGVKRWQAFLVGAAHLALYALAIWFPALLIFTVVFAQERLDLWTYIEGYQHVADGVNRLVIGGSQTVSPAGGTR